MDQVQNAIAAATAELRRGFQVTISEQIQQQRNEISQQHDQIRVQPNPSPVLEGKSGDRTN